MLINDKVDAVYIPDSPSRIKATDYNQIKNEIQECITEAGLTPTKDVIQLPQALKILTAQSGAEEVAKIEAAGQEQLDAVNTAGQTQMNNINTAGAQAVQDAQTAADTATAKATEAATSAGEAASSAGAAASSASAASGSASTATTQATNAADSAELAQKWATQTTAEVVSGQGYGAKYYAEQAANSAASIEGDAEAAAQSATEAAQSAQEAAQSASAINPSTYVPKAGGTMTGSLTLQDAELFRKTTSFAQGDVPEKDVYLGLQRWRDKDNKDLVVDYTYAANTTGNIQYIKRMWQNTAGSSTYRDMMSMICSPSGVSQVSFEKNNSVRVPTPQASSNSTDAATTAWVRSLLSGQSLIADYVVSHYLDDAGNWYRVYKSGWVEQGGIVSRMTESEQRKTTLVKPYANNKYSVFLNFKADDDPILCSRTLGLAREITSTYFTIVNYGWSSNYNGITGYWMACGQGA